MATDIHMQQSPGNCVLCYIRRIRCMMWFVCGCYGIRITGNAFLKEQFKRVYAC